MYNRREEARTVEEEERRGFVSSLAYEWSRFKKVAGEKSHLREGNASLDWYTHR